MILSVIVSVVITTMQNLYIISIFSWGWCSHREEVYNFESQKTLQCNFCSWRLMQSIYIMYIEVSEAEKKSILLSRVYEMCERRDFCASVL